MAIFINLTDKISLDNFDMKDRILILGNGLLRTRRLTINTIQPIS